MEFLAFFVVTFLVAALRGWINDRLRDAALERAAVAENIAHVNKEAADAERRAAEAMLGAARGVELDDDLRSGNRGF